MKEKSNKMKTNQGITLIALIITIIIMLILVAVSIDLIVDGKLFDSAGEAVNKTNEKVGQQQGRVNELMGILGEVEESQRTDAIPGRKVTENKPYYSDGKTAVIPAGFTVSGVPSENSIDGGLVIYLIDDKTEEQIKAIDWTDGTTVANLQTTYDQFVWIPIARENINDMYMCQSEDGTKSCRITVENEKAKCTTHNSNLMAGRLYATTYGETFNSSLTTQTYTANGGPREPDVVTDTTYSDGNSEYFAQLSSILGTTGYGTVANFKQSLQNEYNDIVKSVYENQGFYVGRYETSGMINSDTNATIKVVAGTTTGISDVTWYRMYAQQKKYAENKGLTNVVGSTMIQGAAYDQVMKFVNTASYSVTTGGNVGNTYSEFTTIPYQTGGRDYTTNYSGTTPYNDVSKNIYDLEGNVLTMTTEAVFDLYRVFRGQYRGTKSCK